jgi:hypothetical protein
MDEERSLIAVGGVDAAGCSCLGEIGVIAAMEPLYCLRLSVSSPLAR